jgi:hypothetical protein
MPYTLAVMRWFLVISALVLLVLVGGCNSVSPVAPIGSVLTISASPDRVAGSGVSDITVVARKADGFPVNPGTTVFLSTNRGVLPTSATTDDDGLVRAVLLGNNDLGTATVRANAGAAAEVSVEVQIGIFPNSITIQASPGSMPEFGGEVALLALVRDDQGLPLGGANVNFSTAVGTLESGGDLIITDITGSAEDRLVAGSGELKLVNGDTFEVRVQVAGADGALIEAVDVVTIQRLPVASFSYQSSGLTVVFEDTSTGRPSQWRWEFGDGNTSTLQNPSHSYSSNGTYTVTLTATNSIGSDTRSEIISVSGI